MGSVTMAALMRSGLVLLVVLGVSLAKKENTFSRLIDDLFTGASYERDAIPMEKPADKESNINAINVGVGISIIDMDYDPSGILTTSTWFKALWQDYRLKWDPDHYAHSPTNAILYNTGKVLWIPPIPMKVYCDNGFHVAQDPNNNYAIECSIKIGSWTYDGYHLNLTTYAGEEYMELSDMTRNSRYVVTSQKGDALETKYYDCCTEPYVSMNYRFTIQKAYDIVDGEKVFNKSPEDLDKLFEMYKVTFTHD